MSDLIDLNSPDTNKVLNKKLASPLIPPPAGIDKNDVTSSTSGLPNLMADEKRDSFDNNPFDKVFQETTEYVRKKEDPFEVVLEKVTSSKKSKNNSIECKDDFMPKHTNHADVLKLNKTLNDSVLDNDFNIYNSGHEISMNENFNSSDLLNRNNNVVSVPEIFIQPNSPLNSSALNYSAMNDSLIETGVNLKESALRSIVAKRVSMCIEKGIMEAKNMLGDKQISVLKSRRCHSQGDSLSPKNLNCKQRSSSITDTKRKLCRSERSSTLSSIGSNEYDDQMNKAFLQEPSITDNSVFLDFSNISEITRLNSLSSAYNSSLSLLTNGTMNQAFIESSASSSQILPTASHSPTNDSETVCSDISDLRNRFEALKIKLSHGSGDFEDIKRNATKSNTNQDPSTETVSLEENKLKSNKREEKLIDVEVFAPSNESKSSNNKESISDSSSDSVFTKNISDKSILSEARKIAKTFEEMAEDKSNSSGLDLLSNHTDFNFDNLPDSDDEAVEVNLIDLPVSPLKSDVPANSLNEAEKENLKSSEIETKINEVKEIEMEFTQPEDSEKKIIVTSLLLELEKLIKNEKNPDAEKLLNELEKVLGLKLENNTDLLKVYLENAKSNVQIDASDVNDETENINLKANIEEIKDDVKDVELKANKPSGTTVKDNIKRKSSFVIKKGKSDFIKSYTKCFNTPPEVKKLDSANLSQDQVPIKKIPQSPKQGQSQIVGVRKRFSSDPCDFNSSFGKQQTPTVPTVPSMKKTISAKEVSDKIITVPKIQKGSFSNVTSAMRNKLKNKSETGVSKKGPMKATIPFGSMQGRGSFVKKVPSLSEHETSTDSFLEKSSTLHVPTSTPNSSISSLFKKSKSKPIASSTPDIKEHKNATVKPKSPGSRKFSCNISPVSPLVRSSFEKLASKESPKKNKLNLSSPKRASTPKVLKTPRTPSGIPKYSSLPTLQRRKSMNDLNKSVKHSEASRSSISSNLQKSFGSTNRTSVPPRSPLRTSNKMDLKCKPFNVTTKPHQRRGNEYVEEEKENFS